ncbi:Aste57867_22099 [Aphanomyces stellatus]|uniref:Aste57867_22099 protein n=1 Tax=Aphanomyces stellatus TaxID=120398 RepID=A0A485LJH8_9STRA|nr:hypothetical protein As57867_022030 [Aphanomyces stellatus]VFT98767.1 Aste57867_22099 [Aphanomyces stellatus]
MAAPATETSVELTGRVVSRRFLGKSLAFFSLLVRDPVPPTSIARSFRIKGAEAVDEDEKTNGLTVQVCFLATHFSTDPLQPRYAPFPQSKRSILHGDAIHVHAHEAVMESNNRKHLVVTQWRLLDRIHPDGGSHPASVHQHLLTSHAASAAVTDQFSINVPTSPPGVSDDAHSSPSLAPPLPPTKTRLFATTPFGFQDVAAGELIEKVGATDVDILDGKVIFTMDVDRVDQLHQLRSVEKLFVLVGRFRDLSANRDDVLSQLNTTLPGMIAPSYWDHILTTWQLFHKREATPPTSFRITIKLAGVVDGVEQLDIAQALAAGFTAQFSLEPELKDFDVEVFGHMQYPPPYAHGVLLLGVALSRHTMAYVDLGKHVGNGFSETGRVLSATTLRPTIAYNLMRIAHVEPGDVVVDPMCGCGTIPELVARYNRGTVFCLAGDIAPVAIERSAYNVNLDTSKHGGVLVDVVQWDARRLPLRRDVVDTLITDMPFGKRMGSHSKNSRLYPEILDEFARVTRKASGNAVLLTTEKEVTQRHLQKRPTWVVHRQHTVSVGGLDAKCYHVTYL